ncbi:MAG TPA: hypothetical protein VFY68_00075 [Nitrososphaeraceae archaeon]|nr:hypothetical protein [Nitrososphaeraceae archaeon]
MNNKMSSSSPRVTDWIVGYTLSEPCGITTKENSPSIELRTICDAATTTRTVKVIRILKILLGKAKKS